MYTARFTELNEIIAGLYPALKAVAAHNTTWTSMANHQRAIYIVRVGVMTALSTLDFKLQQATAAAGTGAKDISGKAITQLTQAGGDGSETVAIELRTEELDVDGGFDYIRGVLTVGTDTVYCEVIPIKFAANYPPVSTSAVAEIVD